MPAAIPCNHCFGDVIDAANVALIDLNERLHQSLEREQRMTSLVGSLISAGEAVEARLAQMTERVIFLEGQMSVLVSRRTAS